MRPFLSLTHSYLIYAGYINKALGPLGQEMKGKPYFLLIIFYPYLYGTWHKPANIRKSIHNLEKFQVNIFIIT